MLLTISWYYCLPLRRRQRFYSFVATRPHRGQTRHVPSVPSSVTTVAHHIIEQQCIGVSDNEETQILEAYLLSHTPCFFNLHVILISKSLHLKKRYVTYLKVKGTTCQLTQHINKIAFAFKCYYFVWLKCNDAQTRIGLTKYKYFFFTYLFGEWASSFNNTGHFVIRAVCSGHVIGKCSYKQNGRV